jgi:hypothetical protein
MSSGVVLFENGRAVLWLTGVKRFPSGSIRTGFVENGGWGFECRDGECLAKEGDRIMNRWPDPGYIEKPVKLEWRGDYNEIMAKAQKEFK